MKKKKNKKKKPNIQALPNKDHAFDIKLDCRSIICSLCLSMEVSSHSGIHISSIYNAFHLSDFIYVI